MTVQLFVRIVCFSILGVATFLSPIQAKAQDGSSSITVSDGKTISIEYTLTLEDKTVLDTNVGSTPLRFTQGSHQIILGLESALKGMKVGESKQVTVAPELGYGPVNMHALQEVPLEKIPENARTIGATIKGKDAQGRIVQARVSKVNEHIVVLDYNHPLAGKTLFFDVKILDIQAASTPKP
jgi:FKBP-type peptidyl-prolyl cis-trans isomerase SlyD